MVGPSQAQSTTCARFTILTAKKPAGKRKRVIRQSHLHVNDACAIPPSCWRGEREPGERGRARENGLLPLI